MQKPVAVETLTTPCRQLLLVCRKCSKKLDGGFGEVGADTLERTLKQSLRAMGRKREVRIVRTACFGICPKRAVTMARSDVPGELLMVPVGTGTVELMARLSLSGRSRTPEPGLSGTQSNSSATPPRESTVPAG